VVGIVREIRSVDWIAAISRVGYNRSDRRAQTDGVRLQDVSSSLVKESRKLCLIRGIQQERSEAIVRVHHFDERLVVVAVES
jgi:uncharacterized protein with von Willebrand factor type A (vWA) domain